MGEWDKALSNTQGAHHSHKPPRQNLVHVKYLTIKFDLVRNGPATKYIQISKRVQQEQENYIASVCSPYSLKLPK